MTETYTVDSGDKLTQVSVSGVATKTFGYDGAGRTTSIQTSSGTTSFTYDFESRVTGITYPNASTNSFAYNGLDTRVGKTDSAGTATFRRMGAGVTAPVLGDGSASFTPGISERRGSTSSFYGADYLGTNSSLYSASETVSATQQHDAFGNLTSSSGSSANPFGFAGNWGYQNDSDSGLKLLGHRYYDASTGRFLTRDPIKDGRNWYAYCGNDPIGAIDPIGLATLTVGSGISAILAFGFDIGVGVVIDTADLHLGFQGSVGGEIGMGPYAGVTYASGALDFAGELNTGSDIVSPPVLGAASPSGMIEVPLDGSGNPSGFGIGFGPGVGKAGYISLRRVSSIDLTEWVGNAIGNWWGQLTAARNVSPRDHYSTGLGDPPIGSEPVGTRRVGRNLMWE